MKSTRLDDLLMQVDHIHQMTEIEAKDFINEVFSDGIISRQEADSLFDLNAQIGGSDPVWNQKFREAIKDYLLTVERPLGWITEEECEWLMAHVSGSDALQPDWYVDLILDVLRYAEGAPRKLGVFALERVCKAAAGEKRISEAMVERVRRALFAPASDGATWVTREEAKLLFKLNDTFAFARNDASWNDLFARAIGNHLLVAAHPDPMSEAEVLAREVWLQEGSRGVAGFFSDMTASFSTGTWFESVFHSETRASAARMAVQEAARKEAKRIDNDEEGWLLQRLGWDKSISPAERALLQFLNEETPGFAKGLAAA
ncbi:MAG: hypothetical protein AAF950_09555 [Pseudomonadota bacterium]